MLPELETQLEDLRQRIAADPELAGVDILSHARPSVRLAADFVLLEDLELGESRIGGVPDVPQGFEWPRWMPPESRWIPRAKRYDRCGQLWTPESPVPLGFIAQINLATLPRIEDALPSRGWLYFFYDRHCEPWGFDPDDRGSCRVLYVDCDREALKRTGPPAESEPERIDDPCRVKLQPEWTLPLLLDGLDYEMPSFAPYVSLCRQLVDVASPIQHRILGNPQIIQNPMERECQLASNGVYCGNSYGYESEAAKRLEAGAADWRLLLQIDSDEDGPGWMWGDLGRIYFWIRKQDLEARNFDNVWLILQCT